MRILGFKKEDTAANIASLSGSYVPGGWYRETDTGKVKYAIDATTLSSELQWGSSAADQVQQNLDDYISSNNDALADEISARQTADGLLQDAIDEKAATTYVNTKLAEKVSQTDYDTKVDELELADSTLATSVGNNADGLAAEIVRAGNAESANSTAISDEASARATADTALQGSIDTEKGRIDAILLAAGADSNSFAEIVSIINSVDTENDEAFAGYVASNNLALANEISARQTADGLLQDAIDEKADDSAVVHLSGEETISDHKTFNDEVTFEGPTVFNDSLTAGSISTYNLTASSRVQTPSLRLVDVVTSTNYYLQVSNGELILDTTEL